MPDLDRMRADFGRVSADRQRHQGWSSADLGELGDQIKAAVEAGEPGAIEAWADYLAAESAALAPMAQACRDAEARIRAERAAERERQERRAA